MERNDESDRQANERPLSEQSPDEARRTMKEKVSRGIATVAGALEGFTQQMRENDVPEKTKEAVEKAGETTRKISEATRREGRQMKEALGSQRERLHEVPVTGTAHRAVGSGAATEFSPRSPSSTGDRPSDMPGPGKDLDTEGGLGKKAKDKGLSDPDLTRR